MIYLTWFLIGFVVLRLMVVLINLLTRPWLRRSDDTDPFPFAGSEDTPLVSVLIPARNEAGGIGELLESLIRHDYRKLEILIYDDQSTDTTAEIVQEYGRRDHRISLIKGGPLPAGWLGKNHACHRLAEHADGDYLLFLDADVGVENGLIRHTLAHLRKHRLALLSVFPRQRMETPGERAVVPLMNWILVSMLPLVLTRLSSRPSLSAANGQFMLFDADIYRRHRFHRQVRQQRVEDILIFRMIKKKGLKAETLLSDGQVSCRMYPGYREAILGFSKNVFEFFGGSIPLSFAFLAITVLGFIPVWIAMGSLAAGIYLLAGVLIRLLSSLLSRQPMVMNLLFAPVQQFSLVLVILTGLWNRIRRKTTWKGRIVDQPGMDQAGNEPNADLSFRSILKFTEPNAYEKPPFTGFLFFRRMGACPTARPAVPRQQGALPEPDLRGLCAESHAIVDKGTAGHGGRLCKPA